MGAAAAQTDQAALIAKGQYLATAADCAACHTAPSGGKPYAGGYALSTPLGTIVSTNITPSKTAGIGDYSEADFASAVRQGVAKGGTHLYPAMPYTAFAKISDSDISALYAYFMHGVQAVDTAPAKTQLPFPFSIRASMAVWNLLFLNSATFQPDASKSAEWNRGAYLAEALAHCSTCHTPRDMLMAENTSQALSGGSLGSWYAPNITSSTTSGIGGWSDADLAQYLKTGHVQGKAQAAGPMAEAIENSLQHLSDDDIKSLVVYLRQIPAITTGETKARQSFGAVSTTEVHLRGGNPAADRGWHLFSGTCATCHQENGGGTANGDYPSLFHNTATGADRPDNLIATILFGLSRDVGGKHIFMPAFGPQAAFTDRLSDQDVADVSNYVLANYGNPALTVTAADVATIRQGGPVPLLAKAAPYAAPAAVVVILIIALLIWWGMLRRRKKVATA
jgi:mono/diheme cytochrome c family protein